ncbi:MAG TPA: hypothetical protein VNJ01_03140 [Bacteriovoracaceae bacterium]|nr:hypothetical protein [Bacteriovoracaceae bacterium]
MSLPYFHHIHLKTASLEELDTILSPDLNLKQPVAIHLEKLGQELQRETIGLIENYFSSQSLSFKFPYPLYLITDHERSLARIPLIKRTEELPKFFLQKDSKMNVKEAQIAGKNRLLQQEIRNSDSLSNESQLGIFGESHRVIYELEEERNFYRSILNRLVKVK